MFTHPVDDHLKLALPQPEQAEELAALVRQNLGHLKPWMPWATDDYSVGACTEWIKRTLGEFADTGVFNAVILYDDMPAGTIGFHKYDAANRSAEIGYWISKDFEGKGIITRCCRVLIGYLFDVMKLNRVQINCNVENVRSRAVPERLGFKLEGIHRQVEFLNGKFGDWAVYAILAEEWLDANGKNL